ncbi:MAG TPA: hypothetical protein VKU94_01060 [Geobacterales bacterium]|nr:hypothetical protein [Geobacterales bacterium]
MITVYLDGYPLDWKHGLATVRRLRLEYRPKNVSYLIDVRKIGYNLSLLYSRPSRSILERLASGISLSYLSGKGAYYRILTKADLEHIIRIYSCNLPSIYEVD